MFSKNPETTPVGTPNTTQPETVPVVKTDVKEPAKPSQVVTQKDVANTIPEIPNMTAVNDIANTSKDVLNTAVNDIANKIIPTELGKSMKIPNTNELGELALNQIVPTPTDGEELAKSSLEKIVPNDVQESAKNLLGNKLGEFAKSSPLNPKSNSFNALLKNLT